MTLSGFPAFVAAMTLVTAIFSIAGIYLKLKNDRLTKSIDAYFEAEEAKRDAPAS